MLLASKSKCWSKFLFSVQAACCMVDSGCVHAQEPNVVWQLALDERPCTRTRWPAIAANGNNHYRWTVALKQACLRLRATLFQLHSTSNIFEVVESAIDSKARWRHLRSSAGTLQSIIWSFQPALGPFQSIMISPSKITNAEMVFCSTPKS